MVKKLRAVETDVRRLQRMVAEGRSPGDILAEIQRLRRTLRWAGEEIARRHAGHAMSSLLQAGPDASDPETVRRTCMEITRLRYRLP